MRQAFSDLSEHTSYELWQSRAVELSQQNFAVQVDAIDQLSNGKTIQATQLRELADLAEGTSVDLETQTRHDLLRHIIHDSGMDPIEQLCAVATLDRFVLHEDQADRWGRRKFLSQEVGPRHQGEGKIEYLQIARDLTQYNDVTAAMDRILRLDAQIRPISEFLVRQSGDVRVAVVEERTVVKQADDPFANDPLRPIIRTSLEDTPETELCRVELTGTVNPETAFVVKAPEMPSDAQRAKYTVPVSIAGIVDCEFQTRPTSTRRRRSPNSPLEEAVPFALGFYDMSYSSAYNNRTPLELYLAPIAEIAGETIVTNSGPHKNFETVIGAMDANKVHSYVVTLETDEEAIEIEY